MSSVHAPKAGDYADLIEKLRSGNPDAMDHLLADAQRLAYRFGVMVCGNAPDAEDAMQDALLQTYRKAEHIREPQAFRTWLYRTVKNACLMSRRLHAKEPPRLLSLDDDEAAAVASIGPDPEQLAAQAGMRSRVVEALRQLPENYRLILFLRDLEGLSTAEAANVVGISEDNVKQRLHRARSLLKTALENRS